MEVAKVNWNSWMPSEDALMNLVDDKVVSQSLKTLTRICYVRLCKHEDYDEVIRCCAVLLNMEALKWCDMGLIMGAPISGNVLAYLASAVHHRLIDKAENFYESSTTSVADIDDSSAGLPNPASLNLNVCEDVKRLPVQRISCPSVMQFREHYLTTRTPVIITDAMCTWPALKKWSIPYLLSKMAYRTVPIEIGSKYSDDDWSQKLLPFHQFIADYITKHGNVGYLAQHELFEQIVDLAEDINIPDYCCLLSSPDDVDINAWFGPSGTVSPLHTDPRDNIFAQVMGSKYVSMCSPLETSKVYPYDSPLLFNTCQVDVEHPDFEKFPKFRDITLYNCVLRPGELLYIPFKWWHYLRSLETSFSISFWFGE
ncbi:unnamed protein product [Soboliphyme baturini]|uniref:JmjC domain-containing protein n=1 Tax=Soboliphyme baturini TaxID=241478 RepID=A0A183IG18_9BILA|nr:unnamed protein product [Soboliphyme baturini]